jgi:hypothetical protein
VDGSPDYTSLISWDIRSIPPTAVVESAQIQLQITDKSTHSYPLYAVRRAWEEQQATWRLARQGVSWATAGAQNAADRDSTPIGTLTAPRTGPATITLNSAGVSLVQSWIENPALNFGIIIQNYTSATDGIDFASRESSTAASRPKLTITYSVPASGTAAQAVAARSIESSPVGTAKVTATPLAAQTTKPKSFKPTLSASTYDAALLSVVASQTHRREEAKSNSLELPSKPSDDNATRQAIDDLLENGLVATFPAM